VQVLTRAVRSPEPAAQPPPAWRAWLSWGLALGGLGVSIYLTIVHYGGLNFLVCPSNGKGGAINCEAVLTSPQSVILGIPVPVLGLGFYTVLIGLCSPWAWRAADRRVHLARLVLLVMGIGFVLYLVATELLVIKSICLWCTSVHVLTFIQLILVVATVPTMLGWGGVPPPAPARRSAPPTPRPATNGRGPAKMNRPVATARPKKR